MALAPHTFPAPASHHGLTIGARRPGDPHQTANHLAAAAHHHHADVHHPGRDCHSLALIGWVTLAGYLMAGGANTINMWFDRDIDTKMARTQQRPIPSGRISANARTPLRHHARCHVVRPLLGLCRSAVGLARPGGAAVLRLRLYHLAQAHLAAEHRDRWGGRCLPAAGRLGGDDASSRPRCALPLCHHLLLDAAALLGPRAQQAGRLRRGRRPDDAQRARRAGNQAPDDAVHADADPTDRHARDARGDRDLLWCGGHPARRPFPAALRDHPATGGRDAHHDEALQVSRYPILRCCSWRWRSIAGFRSATSRCPST